MLSGSLGMLASATIGGDVDLYEPVHGSAPDIAGKDIANPIGAIASAAMLLRHTAKLEQEARDIEQAIVKVIDSGYRTKDLAREGKFEVSTTEMGKLVEQALAEVVDNGMRTLCSWLLRRAQLARVHSLYSGTFTASGV